MVKLAEEKGKYLLIDHSCFKDVKFQLATTVRHKANLHLLQNFTEVEINLHK